MKVVIEHDGSDLTVEDPYYVGRVPGKERVQVWYEKDGVTEFFDNARIIEVK